MAMFVSVLLLLVFSSLCFSLKNTEVRSSYIENTCVKSYLDLERNETYLIPTKKRREAKGNSQIDLQLEKSVMTGFPKTGTTFLQFVVIEAIRLSMNMPFTLSPQTLHYDVHCLKKNKYRYEDRFAEFIEQIPIFTHFTDKIGANSSVVMTIRDITPTVLSFYNYETNADQDLIPYAMKKGKDFVRYHELFAAQRALEEDGSPKDTILVRYEKATTDCHYLKRKVSDILKRFGHLVTSDIIERAIENSSKERMSQIEMILMNSSELPKVNHKRKQTDLSQMESDLNEIVQQSTIMRKFYDLSN